jgi:hypothetical protein
MANAPWLMLMRPIANVIHTPEAMTDSTVALIRTLTR